MSAPVRSGGKRECQEDSSAPAASVLKGKMNGRVYSPLKGRESLLDLRIFVSDSEASQDGLEGTRSRRNTVGSGSSSRQPHRKKSADRIKSARLETPISKEAVIKEHCLQSLRSVHEALQYCPNLEHAGLFWEENFGLVFKYDKHSSKESSRYAFDRIIENVNRALDLGVFSFTDRYGFAISLEDLIQRLSHTLHHSKILPSSYYSGPLALVKKTASFVVRKFASGKEERTQAKVSRRLSRTRKSIHRAYCTQMLERVYIGNSSEGAGGIHVSTFLCTYRKFFSTGILFSQILATIKKPEARVPLQRKTDLLNLCRLWLLSGLNPKERKEKKVRAALDEIVMEGRASSSDALKEACEELLLLLHQPFDQFPQGSLYESKQDLNELLLPAFEGKCHGKAYKKLVGQFRDDVHTCLIHLFLSMEPHEMQNQVRGEEGRRKAPGFGRLVDFSNHLSSFAATSILAPIKELHGPLDKDRILESVRRRYLFFIDAAWKLYRINNFSAACALVGALSNSSISRLFTRSVSKKEGGKFVPYEERLDRKTPTKSIKRLNRLIRIFHPSGSFAELRRAMRSSQRKHEPYVPFLGMYLSDFVHIEDGNPDFVEGKGSNGGRINSEKLDMIAEATLDIAKAQRRLFYEMVSSASLDSLETNLYTQVVDGERYEENEYHLLSTNLKPVKQDM